MPALTTITSEALQATVRRLLPSQQGFGVDLEASNVITPIIDLTATAEGSVLPGDLQQAIDFSANRFSISTGTPTNIITQTGFHRCVGSITMRVSSSSSRSAGFQLDDGSTQKVVFDVATPTGINNEVIVNTFDFVVFLRAGDSFQAFATTGCNVSGSSRQIASVNGDLIEPLGFTFE